MYGCLPHLPYSFSACFNQLIHFISHLYSKYEKDTGQKDSMKKIMSVCISSCIFHRLSSLYCVKMHASFSQNIRHTIISTFTINLYVLFAPWSYSFCYSLSDFFYIIFLLFVIVITSEQQNKAILVLIIAFCVSVCWCTTTCSWYLQHIFQLWHPQWVRHLMSFRIQIHI